MERHFVFVHGACLGAWCWYKVLPVLKSKGHKVTAVDLAASGINPKPAHQVRSISEFAEPLMEFMKALAAEERVILVGHSLGGIVTSIAMERFPHKIAAAVLLSTFMPSPDLPYHAIAQQIGQSLDFFMDSKYAFDDGPEKPPTSLLFGREYIACRLYDHSQPEDLVLASHLMRPCPLFPGAESMKGLELTKANYGSVRRVYILTPEENALKEESQRWMVENNPPDKVKVLHDADHMAMISKASELCSLLMEAAQEYE